MAESGRVPSNRGNAQKSGGISPGVGDTEGDAATFFQVRPTDLVSSFGIHVLPIGARFTCRARRGLKYTDRPVSRFSLRLKK